MKCQWHLSSFSAFRVRFIGQTFGGMAAQAGWIPRALDTYGWDECLVSIFWHVVERFAWAEFSGSLPQGQHDIMGCM
jgi:hypothetical protein